MKNKGFIFIETIITVVVLSTSLLYLYSSYNNVIHNEEDRLYYDDIAYIYKTNYIREFLVSNTNIELVKSKAFENTYVIMIGSSFEGLFDDSQTANGMKTSFENIIGGFNVNQIYFVDSDYIDECSGNETSGKCKVAITDLSYNMNQYLKSLNESESDFYLVVEYAEKVENGLIKKCNPGMETGCKSNFASLEI